MDFRCIWILDFLEILFLGQFNFSWQNSTLHSHTLYIQVSNNYVFKKILVVLYPISQKSWTRIQADDFERVGEVSQEVRFLSVPYLLNTIVLIVISQFKYICHQPDMYSRKWALPRQDPNSPDLYIPLMAFITYVLLYGLGKGLRLDSSSFSPDIIIQAVWRCLILQLIESCIIKVAVNLLSVTLPFSDVFAYSGYKYVGLCINTLSRALGGSVNFVVSLYTAGMLGYFVLKTMAAVVPQNPPNGGGGPPRHLILLAVAGLQFVVMLILSWL